MVLEVQTRPARNAASVQTTAIYISGVLAAFAIFLPWFKPRDPGASGNTWHSWDNPLGLVTVVGPIIGALVELTFARGTPTGSSSSRKITNQLIRKLVYWPVLGLGAAAYVWWHLPKDDVVQNCVQFGKLGECDLGSSSWINDPGATRGTQLGFWLAIVACVITLVAGVISMASRSVSGASDDAELLAQRGIPASPTAAELRRDDQLTAFSLVGLLGTMALASFGGIITVLLSDVGAEIRGIVAVACLIFCGGLVAMIVYVLTNPIQSAPPAAYTPRTDEATTRHDGNASVTDTKVLAKVERELAGERIGFQGEVLLVDFASQSRSQAYLAVTAIGLHFFQKKTFGVDVRVVDVHEVSELAPGVSVTTDRGERVPGLMLKLGDSPIMVLVPWTKAEGAVDQLESAIRSALGSTD